MEAGSFFRQSLNLDARELAPVGALTAHSVCVVGFFMVGRSARDAIFLERAPSSWLPWMYLASALAVTLVGLAYGRIADRFRRDRLAAATAAGMAALTLAAWALLAAGQLGLWLVVALYLLIEIAGALVVLQLWMLANDAYNPREARRIFPLVVMGGIVANILCGAVSTGLARLWGTNSLLLFSVLLLLAAAVLSIVEGRMLLLAASPIRPFRQETAADAASARRERSVLLRDPHLRSIAQLLTVTFLATTIVDYQFKLSARAVFSGSSLAAYFGTYYAVTGLLGLAVQALVTRRLLERLGLLAALAVLPLGLGLGSVGFLLTGSLWAASVAQGSNVTFRYTVNDSSVQLLYLPLPARQRALAKAWVEGIGKPGAIAVAAAFLLVYQRLGGSLSLLSVFSIALVGAWLWLLWRTRASYVFTLERTLRRRQLDLASVRLHAEGDAAAILRGALTSANPLEVEHALDLLPHVVLPEVEEVLVSLLRHPAPQVRRLAVGQIAARRGLHHGNLIYQLFEDPDPSVRAGAIRAFCGMAREKAVRSVRPFLSDSEVEVRSAAIAGLVQHGGLDGILTAGPALQELLRGRTANERCWGARALGDIGVRTFYQPLLELLGDTELPVRRAALQAAARLRSPELVPALIYRLGEPAIAANAADALAAIGSADEAPSRDDLGGSVEPAREAGARGRGRAPGGDAGKGAPQPARGAAAAGQRPARPGASQHRAGRPSALRLPRSAGGAAAFAGRRCAGETAAAEPQPPARPGEGPARDRAGDRTGPALSRLRRGAPASRALRSNRAPRHARGGHGAFGQRARRAALASPGAALALDRPPAAEDRGPGPSPGSAHPREGEHRPGGHTAPGRGPRAARQPAAACAARARCPALGARHTGRTTGCAGRPQPRASSGALGLALAPHRRPESVGAGLRAPVPELPG